MCVFVFRRRVWLYEYSHSQFVWRERTAFPAYFSFNFNFIQTMSWARGVATRRSNKSRVFAMSAKANSSTHIRAPLYPSLCPYRCRIRREFNKRRNSLFDSNYLHTTVRTHVGTQWYDNQRHAYVRTRRLQIGNPNYTSSAIRAFVCGIATELLSCGCRYRGYWEHEDFVGRGTHRINRKRK